MKPWENTLEVKFQTTIGDGNFKSGFIVVIKSTSQRATKRWYATETDARRGAAQIFNNIEKSLLK